jgi:drug/metabolite transporter (DMT)-like permease
MTEPAPSVVPAPPAGAEPRRALGLVAITVAMFAWSAGTVLVKWSSLDGLTFAMFRLWTGTSISCLALLLTRRRLSWRTFVACAPGGVLFALDIGLGFSAVNRTSVANLGVIGALAPVAIAVLSARWLGERITRRDGALVALSFVGVGVVVVGASGQTVTSGMGDLLAFLGIGSWVGYWFFSRGVRERHGPIEYFACVMIAGALTMTPAALLLSGVPAMPAASDWAAIAGVALFPGFVGHTLVIWSHRYVESWRSAMITQLVPVLSALLAWVVLHEAVTSIVAAGGAIVVGASGAVIVSAARREHALEEPVEMPT